MGPLLPPGLYKYLYVREIVREIATRLSLSHFVRRYVTVSLPHKALKLIM